ncbi:S-layer homology domain-containing protein [Flavonifractor hominis]|uniref:S-layer homology domain-containing protein n=1 Tax=Flavonifractor hominis TaxID=3133178 RepID=A0ABV1EQG0_9FIRM
MRNLKKALSLVLASATLVGMVSVGASAADFTDKESITNAEAVEMVSTLGIINGLPDGSYGPDQLVDRASMAKMITLALNGGAEPVLGTKTTPTYSDIKGTWAETYIEYCSSMGIIAGDGQGRFNPTGNITGSQAAKMLLVALGYDSTVFGFTGADWEINTNREANDAGLYDGLEGLQASAPLSRDDAAQMIYNALNAYIMEKTPTKNSDGTTSYTYSLSKNTTLLSQKFGAKVFVGTFDGNANSLSLKDGYVQVTGKLTTETEGSNSASFPAEIAISNIGEEYKVIFKDGTGGVANQPDSKDTIYGVYKTDGVSVVNATPDQISTSYTTAGKIKVDGTTYSVIDATNDATTAVVRNFGAKEEIVVDADASESATSFKTYKAAFESLAGQNGNSVKFILNSDGKITKAYLTEYTLGTVTAKNSEKVTISGVGAIEIEDNDIYADIAKNDVVVVSKLYDGDNTQYVVTKAESVSGKVTGYTANNADTSSKVVLDGTTYEVYNKAAMPASVAGDTGTTKFGTSDINADYTLYLVNGFVAAAVKTSETASNYSLVVDKNDGSVDSTLSPLKVVVMAADGTKTTLTVSDKSPSKTIAEGDIVTWTGEASSAKVTVKAAYSDAKTSTVNFYNKTAKTLEGTVTAADCVLFAEVSDKGVDVTGSSYKAYNIRSLGDIKTNDVKYTAVTVDGKVVAAFIDLATEPSGATSSAVYGIVTANKGVVEIGDGEYYNQYSVWTGAESTVNILATGSNDTLSVGDLVKYNPTSDDTYSDNTVFTRNGAIGTKIYVKSYDESEQLLTYYTSVEKKDGAYVGSGDAVTKAVDDDVKIVYVNADGNKAGDEIGINAFDSINGYANAIIVTDTDGIVTTILVETSGECDIV